MRLLDIKEILDFVSNFQNVHINIFYIEISRNDGITTRGP